MTEEKKPVEPPPRETFPLAKGDTDDHLEQMAVLAHTPLEERPAPAIETTDSQQPAED